ncbi:MAG: radical SAM protein [Cyclobacteriaceae bacterium]|nr:radical SAM protein [Cyclobacteriaceae bacterium]
MPVNRIVTSVLNKTKRRDPWFLDDYTINPYMGCSFNCLYCYIRGSKYGIHMEQKLVVKENAVDVLEKQLTNKAKKNQFGIVVLASATEPYLQLEGELKITRQFLELLAHYRFPVHVITKSDLVLRDLDLLKKIDANAILPKDLEHHLTNRAFITFSFSTLDEKISRIFEPGATSPGRRLETLKAVIDQGIHAGVSLMPLLPHLTDSQEAIDGYYRTFHQMRVHYLFPASLTLFGSGASDSMSLVFGAIEKHFPELLTSYRKLYASGFRVDKNYQEELSKRFELARVRFPVPQSILHN